MLHRRRRVVPSPEEWDRLSVDEQFALWYAQEPRPAQKVLELMKTRYFRCVAPPPSELFPSARPAKATLRPRVPPARH